MRVKSKEEQARFLPRYSQKDEFTREFNLISMFNAILSSNFLEQILLKKRPPLLMQRSLVIHFSCRSSDLVYPAQQMPEWFLPGTRMRRLWFSRLRKRLLLLYTFCI